MIENPELLRELQERHERILAKACPKGAVPARFDSRPSEVRGPTNHTWNRIVLGIRDRVAASRSEP
jgi:hypothetical protein